MLLLEIGQVFPHPLYAPIIGGCDKSDNAYYQVPADITDKKITDNTTLPRLPDLIVVARTPGTPPQALGVSGG